MPMVKMWPQKLTIAKTRKTVPVTKHRNEQIFSITLHIRINTLVTN